MTELERLSERLAKMGTTHLHISAGDGHPSPERLAAELNKALDQVEAGEATPDDFED